MGEKEVGHRWGWELTWLGGRVAEKDGEMEQRSRERGKKEREGEREGWEGEREKEGEGEDREREGERDTEPMRPSCVAKRKTRMMTDRWEQRLKGKEKREPGTRRWETG